ncbi:MAG TPA: 3-hydroxyacyl-CoA dehydrogenase NAD-binding domain-containing protein [Gammaproteobacteria bacterium]|nr:3-hydroxyacyl-CoA dehydrogenase NAD-binding domain-containing protein [Gammaproteobacteria bacterium]
MYFRYQKDADSIVTLTMDQPGRSANMIGEEFGDGLRDALGKLDKESDLAGVIITSAKNTFMAGADLDGLFQARDPEELYQGGTQLKQAFRRLETLGKPVVAALNGSALGGGLELALACHHRIAINDGKSEFGFPEVSLGLLPGGGGTVRLPRMLGIEKALPYLMEGNRIKPEKALEAGIVDELAAGREDLLKKAGDWIKAHREAAQPWDEKGFRIPGGDPNNPRVAQLLAIAPAMLKKRTRGNYPAPQEIMNSVIEGCKVDVETAGRIESRYFAHLATGQVAKNMIRAFWYQLNAINAGKSRPDGVDNWQAGKVGILGAGMMGAAIGYCAAKAGCEVVLKDVSQEKAEQGKGYSQNLLDKRVSKGRMSESRAREVLDRILPTGDPDDLQGCDLVIEAVFEDRELKAKVTKEAEERLGENAIFASNTSTLPITGLAGASQRPNNFIGLHFFSPADRMPLVEIICGRETSDETLARAFDFVKQINKTPIVVNDSRGFYTSRVFSTYVMEGISLLAEGQDPQGIESAGLQAGMPVGPLALSDEVSMSLMMHIREQTKKDLEAAGQKVPEHPAYAVVEAMVKEHNRPGKVAGKGFYEYPKDAKKYLWPRLRELYTREGAELPQQEMMDRMLFAQSLETVRCMDENVVTTVADANIGSIFGWGFAPFRGGVLQYINAYGLGPFVERADVLASRYGERFQAPDSLRQRAARNEPYE